MSRPASSTLAVEVRPYADADEPAVLSLLRRTLGEGPTGARTSAAFRWKHLDNPFGRSTMFVAEDAGRIVGFRALLAWRFRVGGATVRAMRPVDTATDPGMQGRGVFRTLTVTALAAVGGTTDLVFNTPNDASGPGYAKLGWRSVGTIPVRIVPRRPLRVAARAPFAWEVLDELPPDLVAIDGVDGLVTDRTDRYLRWRYADAPLGYRAVVARVGGETVGIGVFRVRPRGRLWESTVSDVFVRPGDVRSARRVIHAIRRAADVDHVALSWPRGTTASRAARVALRAPGGIHLMATVPRDGSPRIDPAALASYAVSLGDLEVF